MRLQCASSASVQATSCVSHVDSRVSYHSERPNSMPKILSHAHALPFPLPPPEGLPRFLPVVTVCCCSPLPSAAFSRSSSWRRMSSSASFRRVRSMTSSVLIALRPAWREKVSRSRDVLAVEGQTDVL